MTNKAKIIKKFLIKKAVKQHLKHSDQYNNLLPE